MALSPCPTVSDRRSDENFAIVCCSMSEKKSRRAFLSECGAGISALVIAGITLPILQSCEPTSIPQAPPDQLPDPEPDGRIPIDVSDLNDARPAKQIGGLTGPDGKGVMVTRVAAQDYRAFSMNCTHQGCAVSSQLDKGEIPCPCHGSKFGLDGSVKAGPAALPLARYDAIYDDVTKKLRIKLT